MLVKKNKRKISRKKSNNKKPNKGKSKKRVTIKPKKRRVIKKGGYKSIRKKPTRKKKKKLMRGGDPSRVIDFKDFPDGTIPIGKYMNNNVLENVVITQGIHTIGYGAFFNCFSLKSVELPNTIITIGEGAFQNCGSLESIEINKGRQKKTKDLSGITVGEDAFYQCIELNGNTVLNTMDFPFEWRDTVPANAFRHRRDVVTVFIPPRINKLESEAFAYCKKLKNVIHLNKPVTIGERAFQDCPELESIELFKDGKKTKDLSGITVGTDAFEQCYKLNGNTVLNTMDFPVEWGDTVPVNAFRHRHDVVTVFIPPRITKLKSEAFAYCMNLKEIMLPLKIVINDNAFIKCFIIERVLFITNKKLEEIIKLKIKEETYSKFFPSSTELYIHNKKESDLYNIKKQTSFY
tara:strand:+ start:1061 stop:2275 length:1215 start_codon:yes stop_codon:yes gene_type:complete